MTASATRRHSHPSLAQIASRGAAVVPGLSRVHYEICGADGAPVVVVLGGVSASRHITSNEIDRAAGWWDDMVGSGKAIDTNRNRIVGIDYVTRAEDDKGARGSLHTITTFDQARAIAAVLDALGVRVAHAVVGASYGGMVALAFAARHPGRVEGIVAIGAAHESDPMTTTLRAIQRRIVALGESAGEPSAGVALARALAMTTYRTRVEFARRFSMAPTLTGEGLVFPAEAYVVARGRDYAERTTPAAFRALTLSLDLHSVVPETITVPTTLIAVAEDQLVPVEKIRELHQRLAGQSELLELSSVHGHDAFLNDRELMAPLIENSLTSHPRSLS